MSELAIHFRDRTGAPAATTYLRRGTGPTVVLVHGVGMRASIWEPQIAELAKTYDVIALNMLGHGGSSRPPANARLSDFSGQVLGLLDALGVQRAIVVGHSMGALVALELALSHPTRISGLVALNAVFCRSVDQRKAIERRLTALEGSEGRPSFDGTIERWFGDPVPLRWSGAAANVRAVLQDVDPVGYQRTYRVFATSDEAHRDRLADLAAPALFLTGGDDANSSPAMSTAMADLAPCGRADVIPGERHMMSLTAPEAINQRLLAFLASIESRGRADMTAEPATSFDPLAFRKALGAFLTGVTVVATLQDDGEPRGFTANSFTSVSLDPPLVLICIAKTASSYPVFSSADHFSINILAEAQADLSSLFATKSADKFSRAKWRKGSTGSPILSDVAAWFECRRHDVIEAGDHVILIGEVIGFEQVPANPLGYCRGAHVTFGLALDKVAASGGRTCVGAILEHEGAVLFIPSDDGRLDLPAGLALGSGTDPASLTGRMRQLGIKADLGFLFAVFEDPRGGPGAMSIYYRGMLTEPQGLSPAVRLIAFDDIPWEVLRDDAIRSMLRRYVRERSEDVFGVYVGDVDKGTVQTLARSA
jgi:flavin reductase (DIM6/NTAB) family NADH-FMN oxidoreductase RutF/pimeloyl-ACP methyl ester carboxylesterase